MQDGRLQQEFFLRICTVQPSTLSETSAALSDYAHWYRICFRCPSHQNAQAQTVVVKGRLPHKANYYEVNLGISIANDNPSSKH